MPESRRTFVWPWLSPDRDYRGFLRIPSPDYTRNAPSDMSISLPVRGRVHPVFYERVDVRRPVSEHPTAADMMRCHIPAPMRFDEWVRWREWCSLPYDEREEDPSNPGGCPYDIHEDLRYTDDIGNLGYLAMNGSRSAALFLKAYYSEGLAASPPLAYKYSCYAVLAGDEETRREMDSGNIRIADSFPEDGELMDGGRFGLDNAGKAEEIALGKIARYTEETVAGDIVVKGLFFWDVVACCIKSYADFHEISQEESASILNPVINNREFRSGACLVGHENLVSRMAILRKWVERAGGTNPPLRLPKMDGKFVITELPEYRGKKTWHNRKNPLY